MIVIYCNSCKRLLTLVSQLKSLSSKLRRVFWWSCKNFTGNYWWCGHTLWSDLVGLIYATATYTGYDFVLW